MTLTAGDKAECKEIAREIMREVMKEHIISCPHHQSYLISRTKMIYFGLGMVAISGISSGTVVTILMKVFTI